MVRGGIGRTCALRRHGVSGSKKGISMASLGGTPSRRSGSLSVAVAPLASIDRALSVGRVP
jgi:hypothetical protein